MRTIIGCLLLLTACQQQLSTSKQGNHLQSAGIGENGDAENTGGWVTYTGTLPCGDCSGIETTLTLKEPPDNTDFRYRLKETYTGLKSGKDVTINSDGEYAVVHGNAVDKDATVILLNPGKDVVLQRAFVRAGKDSLLLMDRDAKPVVSALNYTLRRQ